MFQALCPSVGLTLGLASAQRTLAAEASTLTSALLPPFSVTHPLPLDSPLSLLGPRIAGGRLMDPSLMACLMAAESSAPRVASSVAVDLGMEWHHPLGQAGRGGDPLSCVAPPPPPGPAAQCVDILVATPGRLMAHLQGTPGFTLSHLKVWEGGSSNSPKES